MKTYTLIRNQTPLASGITKRIGLVLMDRIKTIAQHDNHPISFLGKNDAMILNVGINSYSLVME